MQIVLYLVKYPIKKDKSEKKHVKMWNKEIVREKKKKKKRKLVTLNPVVIKYVGTYTLYMKRAGSLYEAFDVTYHMTGCGGR